MCPKRQVGAHQGLPRCGRMTHYRPWKAGYMGNPGSGPFRLVPGCLPCRQTSRAHARRADLEGPPARSLNLQTVLTRGRLRLHPDSLELTTLVVRGPVFLRWTRFGLSVCVRRAPIYARVKTPAKVGPVRRSVVLDSSCGRRGAWP